MTPTDAVNQEPVILHDLANRFTRLQLNGDVSLRPEVKWLQLWHGTIWALSRLHLVGQHRLAVKKASSF